MLHPPRSYLRAFAPSREITFSFFSYSFYETNGNATKAKKERARCTKVP
jgi:hypothetical protein